MDRCHFRLGFALAFGFAFAAPALAQEQKTPPPAQADEDENPTPSPLTVGSMAIAADAALAVESMAVDVAVDRVVYDYSFKNKGPAKLTLAASVALPDLEVNNEGTTIYLLPSQNADNVVGLDVKSNNAPVQTTPYVQAIALGIDRLSELKTANIPLIPFGEDLEKALAAVKPDTIARLETFGLVTPRDPTQKEAPVIADWSLHVVHGWMQTLEPNTATKVSVGFTPIKAVYTIDASSLGGFDALKEQVCVTPQIVDAVTAMLKPKGSTAAVADITIANDGPARWLENPKATVTVRKPTKESVVVFCGMDAATQGSETVKGIMPNNSEAGNLRVLIFARNDQK